MKEDVLEQIVDDYLQLRGYFTIHNVRFKPSPEHPEFVMNKDSVPSDVDVVGYNPSLTGPDRVRVVSCKSWQTGFNAPYILAQLNGTSPNPSRPQWLRFRELWSEKWAEAFRSRILDLTGESQFTYCLAVTHLKGDGSGWATDPTIRKNLSGSPFEFLTLAEMWAAVLGTVSTTPAASEVGRLAQLLKAAGLTAPTVAAPAGPVEGSDAQVEALIDSGELDDPSV